MAHPILLYDGVCGLCNRTVQFILRRDLEGVFRFASLQSALAKQVLGRHGVDSSDLDSIYVVLDFDGAGERVVARSDAVIYILKEIGTAGGLCPAGQPGAAVPTRTMKGRAFWRVVGVLLQALPRCVRDWGYRVVARNRYRVFGRYESCPVPSAEVRERFLDSG